MVTLHSYVRLLGGSSHLSGIITPVISGLALYLSHVNHWGELAHLRFVGSSPPSTRPGIPWLSNVQKTHGFRPSCGMNQSWGSEAPRWYIWKTYRKTWKKWWKKTLVVIDYVILYVILCLPFIYIYWHLYSSNIENLIHAGGIFVSIFQYFPPRYSNIFQLLFFQELGVTCHGSSAQYRKNREFSLKTTWSVLLNEIPSGKWKIAILIVKWTDRWAIFHSHVRFSKGHHP